MFSLVIAAASFYHQAPAVTCGPVPRQMPPETPILHAPAYRIDDPPVVVGRGAGLDAGWWCYAKDLVPLNMSGYLICTDPPKGSIRWNLLPNNGLGLYVPQYCDEIFPNWPAPLHEDLQRTQETPVPPCMPTNCGTPTPTPPAPTASLTCSCTICEGAGCPPLCHSCPAPSPTPSPTPCPERTYTVQEGDYPASIAEKFSISAEALMKANGITDPASLKIGQQLLIPEHEPSPLCYGGS
jgi:hypothetical protein